ncbi:hypothetical protein PV04_06447 [Phialophora macrospora]|uniref:Uncharacterized protein n=1 Tax=Phialophora macrospora TaxID=1851006 RepID=A0A0D2CPS8_9EURO|nr:hypothetical protein PV04_06447 [Phialophora macrospora]
MHFFKNFSSLHLDIVGIVAILGEGSTSRNAQASGLSWFHVLPRLYPAPQALMKNHQDRRLPTEPGIVVGALSGRVKNELNFFTQMLHDEELGDFEVELVRVRKKADAAGLPAFNTKKWGHLAALSVLGLSMFITLIGLARWRNDGPALLAAIMLSFCSTTVGMASWWTLDFPEEKPQPEREKVIPRGDVVIFYPKTGAFRVVWCDEFVSRMYFKVERCKHYFDDNYYRLTALLTTILLMGGLIMLGNATAELQAAFAACYILLNVLYWISSALNPFTHVWRHNYDVEKFKIDFQPDAEQEIPKFDPGGPGDRDLEASPASSLAENALKATLPKKRTHILPTQSTTLKQPKRMLTRILTLDLAMLTPTTPNPPPYKAPMMTTALWVTIALTENTRWARSTNIAPSHPVWDQWLSAAQNHVEHERQQYADSPRFVALMYEIGTISKVYHANNLEETGGIGSSAMRSDERPEHNHDGRSYSSSSTAVSQKVKKVPTPLKRRTILGDDDDDHRRVCLMLSHGLSVGYA